MASTQAYVNGKDCYCAHPKENIDKGTISLPTELPVKYTTFIFRCFKKTTKHKVNINITAVPL